MTCDTGAVTNDLADLLGRVESATLEFKQEATTANVIEKIKHTICAMANDLTGSGGGDILIGVRDDGTPVGQVNASDETQRRILGLRAQGGILPLPSFTVSPAVYAGKPVLRIHVAADHAPPLRCSGVIYVRPGPATMRANQYEEVVLTNRQQVNSPRYERRPVNDATLDDLDLDMFRRTYLPSAVAPEVIAENGRPIEQQLASLHLTTPEKYCPTTLGLLVLGRRPHEALPGAFVQFTRYDGYGHEASVMNERALYGNIHEICTQLDLLLRINIVTAVVRTDGLREDRRSEYPWIALRETVMNALMHREYEATNSPVRINWFVDRVEVTNPGGPFGQVNEANFRRATDYRNPGLSAAMVSLKYAEKFGRGIVRIEDEMRRNDNPPPTFEFDYAGWTVTLRSNR